METFAFIIGLDPLLTRGQQLVCRYRTWQGNEEQAQELRDSFETFETDLAECLIRLRESAANLPEQSESIIHNDIARLEGYLTSASATVQNVNRRINRSRIRQFFRANAIANDCDALHAELEEALKLLRDSDVYADLRNAIERIEIRQRETAEILQKTPPPSSSTARESVCGTEGDSFRKYFDESDYTSRLVFDFDTKDKNGNASTQEGRLLEFVLDASTDIHRKIAVRGLGGVGKTCLLRKMRTLNSVKDRFRDGVHNILLGFDATHGELIESLSTAVQLSGGEQKAKTMRAETNVRKVMNMFRAWFANKQCLFLVDDVWETKEIPSSTIHELMKLHVSGEDSKVALTTRSRQISSQADTYFELEPRKSLEDESRAILFKYSEIEPEEDEEDDNKVVNEILEQCSGLPLFLAVAGKVVRTLSLRHGHERCTAYHVYAKRLESSTQSLLTTDIDDYERLSARLMISLELLENRKEELEFQVDSTMAELHRRLSVIRKQTPVPMKMLTRLWELDAEDQAATVAAEFEQVGLADIELERRGSDAVELLRLHDSVYNFAVRETRRHQEERKWHEALVRRYGECLTAEEVSSEWWHPCLEPDGYVHENICRHLLEAGRGLELVQLLLKPQWADRQLKINGIPFLQGDLTLGIKAVEDGMVQCSDEALSETQKALQLISDAVTLSSPFISNGSAELWFQLHGRLKQYADTLSAIGKYVGWMETDAPRPVALCLNDFLGGPGGANTQIISLGAQACCMVMLGDGERVACGCGSGFIAVVNIRESEIEKWWQGHDHYVWAISVGRNGTRLVSGSKDGTAKVWDVVTQDLVTCFEGHTARVCGVEIMKDEKRVVSVSEDGTAKIWEMDTGRVVLSVDTSHGTVRCVAVLGDRNEFVTGGRDGKLRLWNATTGAQIDDPFEGHENVITSVAVTPDEHRIVSGSGDGTVRVWDVATHQEIGSSLEGDGDVVMCVAVSRDGGRIVSGSYGDNVIRVWDSESGTQVCDSLEEHGNAVAGVSFLAGVDSIVSCSVDGTVRLWDTRRKKTGRITDQHKSTAMGVSFSPNGEFVVSASDDKTLRIWNPINGQQVGNALTGHSDFVNDVAITRNGHRAVSVSHDKTLCVWDLESRHLLHTVTGHTDRIWCVSVMPDGNHAVSGSEDKTVRIWDLSALDSSHVVLQGHRSKVRRVFLTDDGSRVVSADFEDHVFVWDFETHRVVKQLKDKDAWRLSRPEVLNLVGETTVQDNAGLSIPLGLSEIIYGEKPDAEVLATLECHVWSWALSPDKKTICVGLQDGHVGFLKLES